MNLTEKLAGEIINEVNDVIREKINIMNARGIIIASSNNTRVGEFHEAAREIIENNLEEIIVHYDGEFRGAKCGVNYPIKILGNMVGVLGITGKYQEIANSAKIVKKLTELMLLNDHARLQKKLTETAKNRYIDEWLAGDVKNITREFMEKGLAIGIDITIPRRFVACTVYGTNKAISIEEMAEIEKIEEKIINMSTRLDVKNIYYKDRSSILLLGMTLMNDEQIEKFVIRMIELIECYDGMDIAIGIDSKEENYLLAKDAYEKAKRANQVCLRSDYWKYRFYYELNMDIFTSEITALTKIEYIHRIFKNFTDIEIRESIVLLENYYESEGSLSKTSERLYLHKNTIQYKLKKIAERTGYDPRSIRHSSLFYNAIFFFRDLGSEFI